MRTGQSDFPGHILAERAGAPAKRNCFRKEGYFAVLRDALDFDRLASPALYFGTTTGQLRMGRDGGEDWSCLFHSLPPIHCLKAAVD